MIETEDDYYGVPRHRHLREEPEDDPIRSIPPIRVMTEQEFQDYLDGLRYSVKLTTADGETIRMAPDTAEFLLSDTHLHATLRKQFTTETPPASAGKEAA